MGKNISGGGSQQGPTATQGAAVGTTETTNDNTDK